jgi:AraC-like DNA-binding protein
MPSDTSRLDARRLAGFSLVTSCDPAELDSRSRVSDRLPEPSRVYRYQLSDRALWRTRFDTPIFSLATRSAGAVLVSHGDSRFATEVAIQGDEGDFYCFTTMLQGELTVAERDQVATIRHGDAASGQADRGLVCRPGHGTRILTSDQSMRTNVFIKVAEFEKALEHMLDARLREPLRFAPEIDWTRGLAASLRAQLGFVVDEFAKPDGLAGNAVALASMTDFLVTLALRAAPHNYADRLDAGPAVVVPRHVRRAEAFMREHCAEPLRIAEVAAAAGCSVRTLGDVFRRFRGTTPLEALHMARLDQVHAELRRGATLDDGASIAMVARRYGFTNASRFAAAFRRRFGEAPADVVRRAGRRLAPP